MSTVEEGAKFERRVFEYFSMLLEKDDVPSASGKHSRIFLHRSYATSVGRKIDFDIAIENYNPNMPDGDWSSLVLIECKCYKSRVNIADIDEFSGKINQISRSGIKGIMVTTNGFSSNGIAQAKNDHIALVVMSGRQPEWIVSRDRNYLPERLASILFGTNEAGILPVAYDAGRFIGISDLLNDSGVATSSSYELSVPYISCKAIEALAEAMLEKYSSGSVDVAEEIMKTAYPEFQIIFEDMPEGVLGGLSVGRSKMILSAELTKDPHRRNFTVAHEIGHLNLHGDILCRFFDRYQETDERIAGAFPEMIIRRMEFQANSFAAYLLMPRRELDLEVTRLFKEFRITKGKLILDSQRINRQLGRLVLSSLSARFNVSMESVKFRLVNENLLEIVDNEPVRLGDWMRTVPDWHL